MSTDHTSHKHIIENIEDWPIHKFTKNRDAFIEKLAHHVLDKLISSPMPILDVLNKSVYLEQKRVKNNPWKVDPSDEKEYWASIAKEISETKNAENSDLELVKILHRIIKRYSEEIIGHFVPKTHLFARKFLTGFFKRLYNNGWGRKQKWIWGSKSDLLSKIHLDGHIEELRALFKKGTVVIVPTHYSNLDSIQIAYGIDSKACVPAFSYGAGLNLYDVEILAYYMNRLGAYRVDRRKKNPIYLETLKSMASLSLIDGLNHIFFPGGTRSRSGAIENKLKLGLLNSVIDAQRHSILNDLDQKIFVVPLSIGYHFVLEAGSLIDQHLSIVGKEKYLKSRNKPSLIKTIYKFLVSLRRKDSEVYLSFGQPMDALGNRVDITGQSFDSREKPVDIRSYFTKADVANVDSQRESIYTKLLADRIVKSFVKENMILTSHLVSYVCFKIIEKQNPELDIFKILKIPTKTIELKLDEIIGELDKTVKMLQALGKERKAKFAPFIESSTTSEIISDGINRVGCYHFKKVLKWKNKAKTIIGSDDLKLLYYYHNKIIHYELPSVN